MSDKITITINKKSDKGQDTIETLTTGGYTLLYLVGNEIKVIGDLDLGSLTPLIMKLAMERFSKGT